MYDDILVTILKVVFVAGTIGMFGILGMLRGQD